MVKPMASNNGKTAAPLAVEFDFDRLTGQDLSDLADAERRLDLVKVAEILSRVVTSTSLGEAGDPQTYLSKPARVMFAVTRALAQGFLAEAEAEKNSAALPTSS